MSSLSVEVQPVEDTTKEDKEEEERKKNSHETLSSSFSSLEEGGEDGSGTIIKDNHQKQQTTTTKRQVVVSGGGSGGGDAKEVYRGPPIDPLPPGLSWPEGWIKVSKERSTVDSHGKSRIDHYWISPCRKNRLRSMKAVQAFLQQGTASTNTTPTTTTTTTSGAASKSIIRVQSAVGDDNNYNGDEELTSSRNNNAPFHLLMLPISEQPKKKEVLMEYSPTLLSDRNLRRDYLSRRFRAYHAKPAPAPATAAASAACVSSSSSNSKNNNSSSNDDDDNRDFVTATTTATMMVTNSSDTTLWSGASSVERALVSCCELPPLMRNRHYHHHHHYHDNNNNNNNSTNNTIAPAIVTSEVNMVSGGSLARGYEIRFAGLVAKHCNNFKERLLAFAILERTLEQDIKEAKEEEDRLKGEEEEEENEDKKGQSASNNNKDEQKKDRMEEGESSEVSDSDDDDDDDDDEPPDDDDEWNPKTRRRPPCTMTRSTRQSTRLQRRRNETQPRPTKKARKEAQPHTSSSSSTGKTKPGDTTAATADDDSRESNNSNVGVAAAVVDRMTIFFSAGGLKILKIWLMDAMTPEYMPMVRGKTKSKPSQYGLMLLPLLQLLSKIPFDKNLIVESKINKQIRKLSKHVDGLIEIFKRDNKSKSEEDLKAALDNYKEPGAGGCVVIQVQGILNELKATWEEHAKKSTVNNNNAQQQQEAVKDPFESLKCKLKERLGELNDLEAGKTEKPEWLAKCQKVQRERERKRPRESLPTSVVAAKKVANTQQLALKEREAERAALQSKLKAAQEERKAHLQRLKNQINKRIQASATAAAATTTSRVGTRAATKKRKHAKSVKWKDGLFSDKQKNKDVLEQVYILPKEPSLEEANDNDDNNKLQKMSAPEAEGMDPPKEVEVQISSPSDSLTDEENLSQEDDDDDEDLFECDYDETLLL